jgi:hypothetical protein
MQVAPPSHDLLVHARTMISIIMGLSLARLLNGVAGLIQHPKKEHLWWPHLCWVLYMMVSITAFWWWQFQLHELRSLTFETYIFLISEAAMIFLLCSVIFPTEISEYDGYGDYFMSRRAWFFGLLIISLLMDILDTLLKGVPHFLSLSPEYPIRIALMIGLCLAGCFIRNLRFHTLFAGGALIYFVVYVARHYGHVQ